jgi:hypothetical protein
LDQRSRRHESLCRADDWAERLLSCLAAVSQTDPAARKAIQQARRQSRSKPKTGTFGACFGISFRHPSVLNVRTKPDK